jgi:nucleotide-binding universal stress UspA family protein
MAHRIVVGCDSSAGSRDAVVLARVLAATRGADVSLLSVYPALFLPYTGESDRRIFRRQAQALLRRDRDELAPGAFVDAVADSSVPRALLNHAAKWHSSMVVVGSDPSTPDGRTAIGRHARQLLYAAPFSVAIARRGIEADGVALRRIGVGYDGGVESEAALEVAAQLATQSGARLMVRTVVDNGFPALIGHHLRGSKAAWEDERKAALAQAEAAVSRLGVPAEVSATIGDPGTELRKLSETVDLIVVGSRRWGTVARLVAGSVGETLVADAGCSLLIVPRPATRHAGRPAASTPSRQRRSAAGAYSAAPTDGL